MQHCTNCKNHLFTPACVMCSIPTAPCALSAWLRAALVTPSSDCFVSTCKSVHTHAHATNKALTAFNNNSGNASTLPSSKIVAGACKGIYADVNPVPMGKVLHWVLRHYLTMLNNNYGSVSMLPSSNIVAGACKVIYADFNPVPMGKVLHWVLRQYLTIARQPSCHMTWLSSL